MNLTQLIFSFTVKWTQYKEEKINAVILLDKADKLNFATWVVTTVYVTSGIANRVRRVKNEIQKVKLFEILRYPQGKCNDTST